MKNKKDKLREIFETDHFSLLDIDSKQNSAKVPDQLLVDSFQEISNFFEKHNREPTESEDIIEIVSKVTTNLESEEEIIVSDIDINLPLDSPSFILSWERVEKLPPNKIKKQNREILTKIFIYSSNYA